MLNIIDVEASGLQSGSYPVEVGIAFVNGERLSMLIQPEPEWVHWDPQAQTLHGISRRTLSQYGKPAAEVAHKLNMLLDGQQAYSDAWVVDKPWLNSLFDAAKLPMQFRLSPIEQVMSENQFYYWDDIKQQVIQELGVERHRASHDAWLIQQTYERSLKKADSHKP